MEIHSSRTNGLSESVAIGVDTDRAAASPSQQPGVSLGEQPAGRRLVEKDIVGLKDFDQLLPLFQRLHHEGCQRDKAGNRELHYDQ